MYDIYALELYFGAQPMYVYISKVSFIWLIFQIEK